jgi:hypothetical protein
VTGAAARAAASDPDIKIHAVRSPSRHGAPDKDQGIARSEDAFRAGLFPRYLALQILQGPTHEKSHVHHSTRNERTGGADD